MDDGDIQDASEILVATFRIARKQRVGIIGLVNFNVYQGPENVRVDISAFCIEVA